MNCTSLSCTLPTITIQHIFVLLHFNLYSYMEKEIVKQVFSGLCVHIEYESLNLKKKSV